MAQNPSKRSRNPGCERCRLGREQGLGEKEVCERCREGSCRLHRSGGTGYVCAECSSCFECQRCGQGRALEPCSNCEREVCDECFEWARDPHGRMRLLCLECKTKFACQDCRFLRSSGIIWWKEYANCKECGHPICDACEERDGPVCKACI